MESLLERLANQTPSETRERSEEALNFFRKEVRGLRVNPTSFYKQTNLNKAKRYLAGRMYTFFYNPKTKDKLPYYDTFPVVLIIETTGNGFVGLNLHYIPPRYRVNLLSQLYDFVIEDPDIESDDEDMKTKVKMSYELLQSTAKLKFFRPCYKKYLTSHIEGRALEITPQYWDIMAMLPTAQFKKKTVKEVYGESIRSVNG